MKFDSKMYIWLKNLNLAEKLFMLIYAIFYTLLTFQLFNNQALFLEIGSGLLVNETQNNSFSKIFLSLDIIKF